MFILDDRLDSVRREKRPGHREVAFWLKSLQVADGGARRIAAGAKPREKFYLPELDTLRFFAFLCVFLYHLRFTLAWRPGALETITKDVLPAGALGVGLFFTLSAYLITKLLLRERAASGKVHFVYFYIRRALRIWPLYFSFLAFGTALVYFNPAFRYAAVNPKYLWLMAIFLGNCAPASWMGSAIVLAHMWSVSIEEQFYLFWPMVIREASERKLRIIAIGLMVTAWLARIAALLAGATPLWIWTFTFTRLDPFAIGILLATVPHASVANLRPNRRIGALFAGFACWSVARYCGKAKVLKYLHIGLLLKYPFAALGSGAFLLATLGAAKAGARFTTNAALVYLGRISYGLYVYHLFAMMFTRRYVFPLYLDRLRGSERQVWVGWLVYIAISLSLTVLLAAASYKWLESPFLKLKERFTYIQSRPV